MRSIQLRRFGIVVALVAVTAACAPSDGGARALGKGVPPDAPLPAVSVITVREGTLDRRIALPATIRAYQEATLYAKVGGYLESIAVDRGDRVERGQILAVLEVPEMRAELGKLEAELRAADVDNKRVSEAAQRAPDLVTPQAVDAARAKYEIAVANLVRTRTLMDYAKLTAPFSGVVTKRWVDRGAFIPAATASSSAMSSAVLTLSDFSRVRVEVAMPQAEVPLVKAGLPATLSVRELPGRSFEGRVTRIAYALDEATKTMGAEIELPNADGALRPGMYASVGISLERKTGVLLVPAEALVTENGRPFAFTVDRNKAHKVALRLGLDDGVHVEVLDGLAANALVVVLGAQSLADGQACRPVEAK